MKLNIKPVKWLVFSAFFLGVLMNARADDSAKLDEVLANQTQILAKLDQIKEELAVVKVRATER